MRSTLHFFDTQLFDVLPAAERREMLRYSKECGIPDRCPFYLDEKGEADELLNGFCRYIVENPNRQSPETWNNYLIYANEFMDYLHHRNVHSWLHATSDHIQDYCNIKIHGTGRLPRVQNGTWNKIVAVITHMYQYVLKNGYIDEEPFDYKSAECHYRHRTININEFHRKNIPGPKINVGVKQYREIWKPAVIILRQRQRTEALANLLFTSGFRISEVLSLHTYHIPEQEELEYAGVDVVVFKIKGKGQKVRHVPISKTVLNELRLYIEEDRLLALERFKKRYPKEKQPTNIFLGERGKPISRNGLAKALKKVSKKSGIEMHAHSFRHSYTAAMEIELDKLRDRRIADHSNGASGFAPDIPDSPLILKELLGHSQITTTNGYRGLTMDTQLVANEATANIASHISKET